MTRPQFVAFSGSFSRPSKTRALVAEAARRAVQTYGGAAHVFDVGDLGDDFAAPQGPGAAAQHHIQAVLAADALIVASPVYKGSYTGLFKHFFDLIDPLALAGKPVLLAATGGGDRHALMIEHQMRPLFGFFESRALATGVYLSAADFDGEQIASPAASERLDRALTQFAAYLPGRAAAPLRAVI
ncbi:NAD(P)H-dependent oxidoreductase [Paracoccus sp. (in: a-proteobacteria)]|uniref:NAD(P)H-dependent oxidoreductase n=1 Tax=Paracoccus sp. TaxID=267 RepID=UPI0026DF90BB|nr:NAD(P)H-dependent oxidoreductase [Paracoccus sp. (in: a-proteobacteria)]MDO5648705.1 NAD(P)H-dependent oxidoreductase [Paracoccus sp. (in: a-proteobacteria)]